MIQVELSATEIPVEPGGTAQLTVSIHNKQEHDDHVFLEIEGIDMEWYALPVPAANVAAGQTQTLRVLFKLTRSSESKAGNYPFVVRAKGMETGDSGVQQASLIVKPFSALQVELAPKRVTSSFLRNSNSVDVIVSNQGNSDETLDLYASDPEDACAYEFATDRVTVKTGRNETVSMLVEPVTRPILGASRLYGFAVTARSTEDSYVSCNAHGQLERKALLSPVVATVLALLFLGGAGWALFHPRPVLIKYFTASPMQIKQGEEVTLSWNVANLSEGLVQPENFGVKPGTEIGSCKVHPDRTTVYTFVANGGGRHDSKNVTVIVEPSPPKPAPRIVAFTANRVRIHAGEPVTLAWKLDLADKIMLNPIDTNERDADLYRSREDHPAQTTTYVLTAKGPGGVTEKSVKVEVFPMEVSLAEIKIFKASPATIIKGHKTTLSWAVEFATSIEIDNNAGTKLKPKDKLDVTPDQTTTYTLRVLDDKGNLKTQTVTVTVNPEVQPLETPNSPPLTATPPPGEIR